MRQYANEGCETPVYQEEAQEHADSEKTEYFKYNLLWKLSDPHSQYHSYIDKSDSYE